MNINIKYKAKRANYLQQSENINIVNSATETPIVSGDIHSGKLLKHLTPPTTYTVANYSTLGSLLTSQLQITDRRLAVNSA